MKHIPLVFFIIYSSLCFSNPIFDIPHTTEDQYFNFFVEIPAGTKQKWELNKNNGLLEWEESNGKKRVIDFLGYPGNYGFIPQTLAGDDDPIDVIHLGESVERGQVLKIKIIGGLYFKDRNKEDIKLIAIDSNDSLSRFNDINNLFMEKSSILDLLKIWFLSYKEPGKMIFYRFLGAEESIRYINEAHEVWKKNTNKEMGK
jgi:inorganic pyrophosphatase